MFAVAIRGLVLPTCRTGKAIVQRVDCTGNILENASRAVNPGRDASAHGALVQAMRPPGLSDRMQSYPPDRLIGRWPGSERRTAAPKLLRSCSCTSTGSRTRAEHPSATTRRTAGLAPSRNSSSPYVFHHGVLLWFLAPTDSPSCGHQACGHQARSLQRCGSTPRGPGCGYLLESLAQRATMSTYSCRRVLSPIS